MSQPPEEPDVLVVDVDVHEAAQAFAVDQAVAQARVARLQVVDERRHGVADALDSLCAPRVLRRIVGMRTSMAIGRAPVVYEGSSVPGTGVSEAIIPDR